MQDPRPPEWAGLLSEDEWGTAVRAVGCERLLELRSLMAEFTPGFRSHVVRQLAGLDGYPVGQKPLLAVARSVYDLEVEGCPCGELCDCHIHPDEVTP